jgi:hypothetical protein
MRRNGHSGSMSVRVAINIAINVGVAINSKDRYCLIVGLDSWLSLMSTLGD